jgi:ribose transport system substrate-binding protein
MKKSVIKIAIITLVSIFIIAAVLSIKYITEISDELNETNSENKDKKLPQYHFMIIANELNFSSGKAFINGVNLACEDYNSVVEINEYKRENIDQQIKNIAIAVASKVDGIIVQVTDQELFVDEINKAIDEGIPVITIFEDSAKSKRLSFIGVNSYELGKRASELAANAVDSKGEMAIIFDGLEEKNFDTSKNLIEEGVRDGLVTSPQLTIKKIDISTTGILGAGDIAKEIIRDHRGINVIFCTSAKTTLGVAEAIVDLNMVGKIKIVGYGDDHDILQFIDRNVIDASLVSDTKSIGYQSIESAYKYLEEGSISDFEDTGIYVIDETNIDYYIEKLKEEGDDS